MADSTGNNLTIGKYFNETDKNVMRDLWIRRKMRECKKRYSHPAHHNIFCGTWNVNGKEKMTSTDSLDDWIHPSPGTPPPDIYILGFQEIVPLTPMNIAVDPLGPVRTQYWLTEIQQSLSRIPSRNYHLLGAKNLVGILLCIFIDEAIYGEITDVRWTTTAVGVMGVMGNKGAVVVRFNLYGTSLCFICAHLAAARENVQGRNNDYRNIMERSLLVPENISRKFPSITPQSGQYGLLDDNSLCTILDHDIIFWIGDFNYRIDVSMNLEEIMSHICCENIPALRKKDQLNIERSLGNVFQGFEEAPLTFLPTYKFIVGTDAYDTRPEKKLRPPAWCDRILWKDQTLEGLGAVVLKSYRRSTLKTSDHKPVSAAFVMETRVVDSALERHEYNRLLLEVGSLQCSTKPEVEISPLEFKIPQIRYMERRHEICYLRNTGTSGASWRFIPKPDDVMISEQWIHIEPTMGIIGPGETMRITIEIYVDYRSLDLIAPSFENWSDEPEPTLEDRLGSLDEIDLDDDNETCVEQFRESMSLGPALIIPLNEILIIRVENGHDYYLTIAALFSPTSGDISVMKQQHLSLNQLRTNSFSPHLHLSIAENSDEEETSHIPAIHMIDLEVTYAFSFFSCSPTFQDRPFSDNVLPRKAFADQPRNHSFDDLPLSPPLQRKGSRRQSLRISRTPLDNGESHQASSDILSNLSFRTDHSTDETASEEGWTVTVVHQSDRVEL